MDYYSTIKSLYLDIQDSQFLLQDDNGVVTIIKWTYQYAEQPTIEYLQSQAASGDLWFAKSNKIASLNLSCASAITGGFVSSALGESHTYPSKENSSAGQFDQTNLNNAATVANMPGLPGGWTTPLWAEDESQVWTFSPHTAVQVNQVMLDFLTTKNDYRNHLSDLMELISAATTPEEVNAINW